MKKAFSLLSLLGMITMMILQGGMAAEAVAKAQAVSSVTQSVGSATMKLTAIATSAGANTGTSLALTVSNRQAFFYLKNFGTMTLNGFSMTQTRSTATIRYCVGQEFRTGNPTTCFDNTAAILVGTGTAIGAKTFTVPLATGGFYAFSSISTSGSSNTVSVTVSRANITNKSTAS
jgi:hypothetical protein